MIVDFLIGLAIGGAGAFALYVVLVTAWAVVWMARRRFWP